MKNGNNDMKKIIGLVVKIVFIVLIIGWMAIVITDYFTAKNGNNPKFCISEKYHVYNEDGDFVRDYSKDEFEAISEAERTQMYYTYQCNGLGYKFFRYQREFRAIEFGPFFTKERLSINN